MYRPPLPTFYFIKDFCEWLRRDERKVDIVGNHRENDCKNRLIEHEYA